MVANGELIDYFTNLFFSAMEMKTTQMRSKGSYSELAIAGGQPPALVFWQRLKGKQRRKKAF